MPRRPLTIPTILSWADHHHERTGRWPITASGPVLADLNEKWVNIDAALRKGFRSLSGGDSLARLLDRKRGVRNIQDLPALTEELILQWAKNHHKRTGRWPNEDSGPIFGTKGETWQNINAAMREGNRGWPAGDTLAQFLARTLGVRTRSSTPDFTVKQILKWADDFHERTGAWPQVTSPSIGLLEEDWRGIDAALREGYRGLPGNSSLAKLLGKRRGARNSRCPPRLTLKKIRTWAKAHRERTGAWPTPSAGPIVEAPGETWNAVEMALIQGLRGLAGGSSLRQLLRR